MHPEIRKIADDAARGLHYSFVAAALQQETPFAAGSVEEEFRRGIHTCKPEIREALRTRASQLAGAPAATRLATFGRYGSRSVTEHGSSGFHRAILDASRPRLAASALAPIVGLMKSQGSAKSQLSATPAALKKKEKVKLHFAHISGLSFYITQVRCKDETDGFMGSEAGDDEIVVGGLAVDSNGITTKAVHFMAGSEFDDGDKVVFSGTGKEFCHFDIPKGGPYPKLYSAVLMMAEADWGGFASAVNTAYETAFPSIKKAYEEAIGVVLSPMLTGELADVVAKIYVDVVGWVVDTLVNFMLTFVGDDVFSAQYAIVRLHTPLALPYGNTGKWNGGSSPVFTYPFKGHGGSYIIKGYWKVHSAQ